MEQLPLFSPEATTRTRRAPCESCGGVVVIRRTGAFFEDDWACQSCAARGVISWSRVFGERAEEAKREGIIL